MPWLIGDIHGCLDALNELLTILPPEEDLIFLGDYIEVGKNAD